MANHNNAAGPPYVMLNNNHNNNMNNNQANLVPPPQWRNVPRYNPPYKRKSGGSCCLRFICCCYCCLFVLIVLVAVAAFLFFYIYKPRVPSYKFENFDVKSFNIQPDFSLVSEFTAIVKADNPNKYIKLKYGKSSSVLILFERATLCSGEIPSFRQPEKNVTMINIDLKGKTEFGSSMQQSLQQKSQEGKVPLEVRVKVPITVVLGTFMGSFPLKEFTVNVKIDLIVDNLLTKQMKVSSSKYDYKVDF